MKNIVVLSLLFFSLALMAQETHSPQYKCDSLEGEQTRYLLVGNKIEGEVSADFSHEVIFVTKDEYDNHVFNMNFKFKFKIMPSEIGFLTYENAIAVDQSGDIAYATLMLNEALELTYSVEFPMVTCSENEEIQCFENIKYLCSKQTTVD